MALIRKTPLQRSVPRPARSFPPVRSAHGSLGCSGLGCCHPDCLRKLEPGELRLLQVTTRFYEFGRRGRLYAFGIRASINPCRHTMYLFTHFSARWIYLGCFFQTRAWCKTLMLRHKWAIQWFKRRRALAPKNPIARATIVFFMDSINFILNPA